MSAPFTKPELIASFQQRATTDDTFWSSFSPDAFIERPEDRSWSPAQNVVHLISATKPVVMALRLPRFLPRLLFGKSNAPSRHYEKIVQAYHDILAGGAQASGKYAPKPVQLSWQQVQSDGISVLCRTSRPENGRGFHNTERLYI